MDKETFKEQMLKLKHFYPNWKLDLSDKKVVKNWYYKLKKYNKKEFKKGINDYIENEIYDPTIAGLNKHINNHTNLEDTVSNEQVNKLMKRIRGE